MPYPVISQVAGGRAVDGEVASQMMRFYIETLALPDNRVALANLSGHWLDWMHERTEFKCIVLDMDGSTCPTQSDQEGADWEGYLDCKCCHPLFLFNQLDQLEPCALCARDVHNADGWTDVLKAVMARYADLSSDTVLPGLCRLRLP